MNLFSGLVILGLLGIAIAWPVILAAWAYGEARGASMATFALAALAATWMALDSWAPSLLGPLSSGRLPDLGSAGGTVVVVAQALIVVAPMTAGFAAARRAQSRGRTVPRWLIASFLVPELLLVIGGAGVAASWARLIWGPTYDPLALGAATSGARLFAALAAIPAAIGALVAFGVTVWLLVTYDRGAGA